METYLAHIRRDTGEKQFLSTHCRGAAQYAAETLRPVRLGRAAYLAGLLHDCGKYSRAFQDYIAERKGERGSVIHTFQGCRMLLDHFHQKGAPRYEDLTCELLAYTIGAHHGLFDCIDDKKRSGFLHRQTAEKTGFEEACERYLADCADWQEVEGLFSEADAELRRAYEKLPVMARDDEELSFYIGLLVRLLLSAVIDGDRRDTARFMNDAVFPSSPAAPDDFWEKYLNHMERRLELFPQKTAIERARSQISLRCRQAAAHGGGVYRLNVPTGAGKTIASLRFALAHAAAHGKQRIIFTAPLLTILEQNATILRDFIGDDSIVLEHHSNVVKTREDGETLDEKELLAENWHAATIITTMSQLLNTMFSGKTTAIRRFQSLCNSIIVIDEVQTVPGKMLTLFNLTVNFLSEICGVTFVLCSATQPCLEAARHPLWREAVDMVPYDAALWRVFHRTVITDAGAKRLEEIPGFVRERLETVHNILVVCNKKAESEYIFSHLHDIGAEYFHLSAAMCMAHRKEVLSAVEQALEESRRGGNKVVLVSTQVVEAGVDISFDCVVRLQAGMDSVVQAAGRCNRHGETPHPVPVYLVQCADERLGRLREIQEAKTATEALLVDFRRRPEQYHNDLASDTAIRCYYHALYRQMDEGYQDFATPDKNTLFSLLSENRRYADEDCECGDVYFLKQAFKKAGELFQVFDDDTDEVLVPYGNGKELIRELCAMGGDPPADKLRVWLERAKPYTVSVYQYQKDRLGNGIGMRLGIAYLQEDFYDEYTGLRLEPDRQDFWEV